MPDWVIIIIVVVLFIGLSGFMCYALVQASKARQELEEQLFQYEILKDEISYKQRVVPKVQTVNKPLFLLKGQKTYPVGAYDFLTEDIIMANMAELLIDELVRNKLINIVAIVNDDRSVTYTASIEVLGEPRK